MEYLDEIRHILASHDLKLDAVLNNGLSNIVVKAADAQGELYALKYYPRDTFKIGREERFIELASGTIPVPHISAAGEHYLITRFVAGESGSSLFSRPSDASESTGVLVGAALARLHTTPAPVSTIGFLGRDISAEEYRLTSSALTSNTAFLRRLIREQEAHLRSLNIFLPPIDTNAIVVANDTERVLVHHDVCLKNILFADRAISAFLDFEYAVAGSPLFDIAKVHVLAKYLAYHTGGSARYLDADAYLSGFARGYGRAWTYSELRPFYLYILLNYILFWVANPLANAQARDRILPIHHTNLARILTGEDMTIPAYSD